MLAWRLGLLWLRGRYFDVQLAAAMRRTPREQEFLAKHQRATQQAHTAVIQALRDYQATSSAPTIPPARKRVPR